MAETPKEKLSRVQMMVQGIGTWDLSPNDIAALDYVLSALQVQAERADVNLETGQGFRRERDVAIAQLAIAHGDLCENGHATHEECTDACSCVGSGRSRLEIAEARAEKAEATFVAANRLLLSIRRSSRGLSLALQPYPDWAGAGGPNECSHGRAKGVPCAECDMATVETFSAALKGVPA
jgi:hypothetical protein